MEKKKYQESDIDLLKHFEELSGEVNGLMEREAKRAFRRYPVTLGLLILTGFILLQEGIKGLMRNFGIIDIHPIYILLAGLLILIGTGKLYKKLDK